MSDNRPSEAHGFYSGPPDRNAIQGYLNIRDDRETARLAAMMAPKPEAFDPVALVDAATALQAETPAGLIRRREMLVETMNYATLLALQQELGVTPSLPVKGDKRLHDPLLGPVLRKLDLMLSTGLEKGGARIAKELADADTRTALPRPVLPCGIEEALRYVTDSPDVPWQILEGAFMDYLGLSRVPDQMDIINKRWDDLKNQIADTRHALAELKKKLKRDTQHASSKRMLGKKLKSLQADLDTLRGLKNYCESFTPGMTIPATVAKEVSASYDQYRKAPIDGAALASLSTDFLPFYRKHHAAYKKLHTVVEKTRKAKAAKNRAVAPRGSASRERAGWIKRTVDFLEFLKVNPPVSSDLSGSINTFADKHCKLSTSKAKLKVRDFLETLASHLGRDFDAGKIRQLLRNCGIKALTEDAVRECFELMKSTLGRSVEKKLKKGD